MRNLYTRIFEFKFVYENNMLFNRFKMCCENFGIIWRNLLIQKKNRYRYVQHTLENH